MAERSTSKPKDEPVEVEPVEPQTSKELANAKQTRLEAERAKAAAEGQDDDDTPEGRRVKEVDGERFVLVNGGWIRSGKAR